MSDFKLYAIELENRKVFLQVSMPIDEIFLFQECEVMFDFVKKNLPVKIIHTIDLDDVLKVNYWVKYFMRYYGINNVRGGNYTDEILSPELIQFLKLEIDTTFDNYEDDIELFENVLIDYNNKNLDKAEKEKLENRLSDFINRQKLLEYLQDYDGLLEDLDWVKNEIINMRLIYEIPDKIKTRSVSKIENKSISNILSNYYFMNRVCVNTYDKNKYKTILNKLQKLINNYYLLNNNENIKQYCCNSYLRNKLRTFNEKKDEASPLVFNPIFTLDNFFLHPHIMMNWGSQVKIVDELISKWISMYYSIKIWRDEIEFDLSSYPKDFKKYAQYALQLYEIRVSEPSECFTTPLASLDAAENKET